MKKIEAIIRPERVDVLIDRLESIGITGMNIFKVKGYGAQKGHMEVYRGVTFHVKLREKIRIEVIVSDDLVDKIIDTIVETAQTGQIGDGKIFISPIENVIRIRTGEKGLDAL